MIVVVTSLACALLLGIMTSYLVEFWWYHRTFRFSPGKNETRVAVISPCKGYSPWLIPNAERLLDQDHPRFTVSFVVESPEDPAHRALRELASGYSNAEVLVSGHTVHRSQKIHNLLHGVRKTSSDILVFVDNDMIIDRRDWIKTLVTPLEDRGTFISTAFFRVLPETNTVLAHMVSLMVNVFELNIATFSSTFFGGSFAIRRQSFNEQDVAQLWDRAIAEDFSVIPTIQRKGLRVVYVPDCISGCRSVQTLRGFWTWMTRQFHGLKHWPVLYALTVLGLGLACLLSCIWPVVLVAGPSFEFRAAAALVAVCTLLATGTWLLIAYYPHSHGPRRKLSLIPLLSVPLLVPFAFAASVAARQGHVVWANIRYALFSDGRVKRADFL